GDSRKEMPQGKGIALAGKLKHRTERSCACIVVVAFMVQHRHRGAEILRRVLEVRRAWPCVFGGKADGPGGDEGLAVAELESYPTQRGAQLGVTGAVNGQ